MVPFPNISFNIDIIPVTLALAGTMSAASLAKLKLTGSERDDLIFWALGGLGVAVGVLLIVLRGHIPDFISIPIGNSILIVGHSALSMGTARHVGRGIAMDLALGLVLSSIFVGAYLSGAGMAERVAIYAISLTVFAARVLRNFLAAPRGLGPILAIAAIVTMTFFEIGRLITLLWSTLYLPDWQTMSRLNAALGVPIALGIAIALVTFTFRVLSKAAPHEVEERPVDDGPAAWRLSRGRCAIIIPNGKELRLTGNELIVLQRLGESFDPVDRLTLNALIGRNTDNPKDRGVDFLLSRLRRKCSEAGAELPVTSVRGRGYLLSAELQQI